MRAKLVRSCWVILSMTVIGCAGQQVNPAFEEGSESGMPKQPSSANARSLPTSVVINDVRIEATSASFWRDWMPMVSRPGPDGGSPLYSLVRFQFHNTGTTTRRFSFTAEVHDGTGGIHAVPFRIMRTYSGPPWNGEIGPGERRDIEILSHDGPYLQIRSRVFAVVTWSDGQGGRGVLRSPDGSIDQTM